LRDKELACGQASCLTKANFTCMPRKKTDSEYILVKFIAIYQIYAELKISFFKNRSRNPNLRKYFY